jgi:hypothetical protein
MVVTYHIEVTGLSAKVTSTPPVPPAVLKQNLDRVQFTSNDSRTNITYLTTPFEDDILKAGDRLEIDTVQGDKFVAVTVQGDKTLAVIVGKHHFRCGFINNSGDFVDWLKQDGADTPVEP